ncbi:MAG: 50S ribosomal protein L17 [Endomicrobia bacterium]|nr:50S ribosomal protein L17 [Endomicrobiia bacterium]
MIKNISKRKLNRPSSHRNATLRNLAGNLIRYESIKTTKPKAKELRSFIEHLITRIKRTKEVFNKYRVANMYLYKNDLSDKLIKVILPRYENINSGYVEIATLGNRKGDNSEICIIRFKQ